AGQRGADRPPGPGAGHAQTGDGDTVARPARRTRAGRPGPVSAGVRSGPGVAGRVLQEPAGDHHAVDLVGPVVEAGVAGFAVHLLEWRVCGDAERAVDLDGPVDHVVEHAGAPELDEADLDPGLTSLVHGPRRVERHHPGGLDLGCRLGHVPLDLALLRQQRAVGVARVGPLAHELEGPLRLAEPPHAVEDPPRPQPLLGDDEAVASGPEQVLPGDAHVVVPDLAVGAAGVAHRRHDPDDVVA